MLLTNTDVYKILKYLGLPYTKLVLIKEKINLIAVEEGQEFEGEVLSLLAQLDSLELKINEEKSNPNAGLIRADVLEWEAGGSRFKGMSQEYNKLCAILANFLGIDLIAERRIYNNGSLTIDVIL